jgi:dUTP pyrophosphatase
VGYDLHSAQDGVVPPRGRAKILTDLAIQLPPGTYGRIAPRSGLAWKHGIDVGGGVIDPDYRGNVGIVLFNHWDDEFPVRRGDRVAQLVVERVELPAVQEVEEELDDTARGAGGFGSTDTTESVPPEAIKEAADPSFVLYRRQPQLYHIQS